MRWVQSSIVGLWCVFSSASCGGFQSTGESDTISSERAAPPRVTSASVSLAPRIAPGGTADATAVVTVANLPRRAGVALAFSGDDVRWDAALPLASRSGDTFTFAGPVDAPLQIGLHGLSWNVVRTDNNAVIGALSEPVEVTCSDGVYCNGEERYVRGECVVGKDACDDGEGCTTNVCNEADRTCAYVPAEEDCDSCDAKNCIPKCARGQECGDDGCGGACGSQYTDDEGNCLGGLFCVDGKCDQVDAAGTCGNPLPLLGTTTSIPAEGLVTTVYGDSSTGLDLLALSCGGEGIQELVYEFDVAVRMGFEIRMLAADGDPDALDTVLGVHEADCFTQSGGSWSCSDDASPPGGLGSLVRGLVDPGSYRLIATGYSSSQVGPFQLQLKFTDDGCVPTCEGKFCGTDGCGGECGSCALGETCGDDGRCGSGDCEGSCTGRQCGSDGCTDGACGDCPSGQLCADEIGKCVPADVCDHLLPECGNCPENTYCGTDCQCHRVDEDLIDLVPAPADTFLGSVEYEWREFTGTSCAIAEGCVPGAGKFLLMRFATDILNQGVAGFTPGDPVSDPSNFHYHSCHQHYHFEGFAQYQLLALDGETVLEGRKQSYCMEDTYQHLQGPAIPCEAESTCDDQGIQAGWADLYPNSLDCQWLVVATDPPAPTDLPMGKWYYHRTCTNTGRVFHENNFENNCTTIPVWVPASVPPTGVLRYGDITDKPPFPN